MFTISYDGIITLSRGDSVEIPLLINQGTIDVPIRYHLKDSDAVYFAITEPHQLFEDAIVKKVYTREDGKFNENDDLVIIINTIDTEYLRPGTYYYEIKLRQENLESNMYQVDTIISKRKFIIKE